MIISYPKKTGWLYDLLPWKLTAGTCKGTILKRKNCLPRTDDFFWGEVLVFWVVVTQRKNPMVPNLWCQTLLQFLLIDPQKIASKVTTSVSTSTTGTDTTNTVTTTTLTTTSWTNTMTSTVTTSTTTSLTSTSSTSATFRDFYSKQIFGSCFFGGSGSKWLQFFFLSKRIPWENHKEAQIYPNLMLHSKIGIWKAWKKPWKSGHVILGIFFP